MRIDVAVFKRALFFVAVFAYLGWIGTHRLPSVHFYYDAVAIRDTGTLWHSLTWNPRDGRYFLPAAVMGHVEGPWNSSCSTPTTISSEISSRSIPQPPNIQTR